MKARKESKDWYIAATHWLTAGIVTFAIAFICGFAINMAMILLIGIKNLAPQTIYIFSAVVSSFLAIPSVWLGVKYAATYINKAYIIRNKAKITNLATLYLLVTGIPWGIFSGVSISTKFSTSVVLTWSIVYILGLIVQVGVFYLASKRYIHTTDNVVEPTEQNSFSGGTEHHPQKRKFFIPWLLYSIFFLLLYSITIISYFIVAPKGPELYALIDNLVSLPAVLALILYIFKKALGPKMLWKVYTVAFFVCDFTFNLYVAPVLLHESSSIDTIIGLLITLPAYVALALYAFQKNQSSSPMGNSVAEQVPGHNEI